jgi:hypothetical protein
MLAFSKKVKKKSKNKKKKRFNRRTIQVAFFCFSRTIFKEKRKNTRISFLAIFQNLKKTGIYAEVLP